MHATTLVKVNAWIDAPIAPLVMALNDFPNVLTLDSCQGYNGEPAHIYFCVHGGPMDLAAFVHELSIGLGQQQQCHDEFHIQIEWVAGSERPMATLFVRLDFAQQLAEMIHKISHKFSDDRSSASSCGTSDREPRNSTDHQSHPSPRHECGETPQSDESQGSDIEHGGRALPGGTHIVRQSA